MAKTKSFWVSSYKFTTMTAIILILGACTSSRVYETVPDHIYQCKDGHQILLSISEDRSYATATVLGRNIPLNRANEEKGDVFANDVYRLTITGNIVNITRDGYEFMNECKL